MSERSCVVRYLPASQEDLLGIMDYILRDDPPAAAAFVERIDECVGHLSDLPLSGALPRDDRLAGLGYRFLVVDSHLVLCVAGDDCVEVRRILNVAREYRTIL